MEEGAMWSQRTERGYEKLKPLGIPGGRLPHFSIALPKVIELDEGDKLHLDCTVDGWPRPSCKFCSNSFLELPNGIDKLTETESFASIEHIDC